MKNLLPFEGTALYFPNAVCSPEEYFTELMNHIPWQFENIRMFGKDIVMRRMTSWHADDGLSYTYSGKRKTAAPWTDTLLELKAIAESICETHFNSCLLNLYNDGRDAMGWHSDSEKALGIDPVIASVSLGAERKFSFRHKSTGEQVSIVLESGSLLLMGTGVQSNWKHALPASAAVQSPRINLTFRRILSELSKP